MSTTTMTIGMATHRDFDGVYFTLNALRLYHADVLPRCEFVIVDNDPDGPQSEYLRGFSAHLAARRSGWPQPFSVQYVPYRSVTGTAAPRDHVFHVAQGDVVLVIDSHVNLWPNSLALLLEWYDANPESQDLIQGPLIYDDLSTISTHFADVWRDGMWGTWDCDPRGVDPEAKPFEIPAQGLGLFSCRKSAWLGFNPHFREFGGEEWYIHEKFRKAGRRCFCLPFLRWIHRFSPPGGGRDYPVTLFGKIRNYVLGLQELGLPLERLRSHCVDGINEDPNDPVNHDAHLSEEQFTQLVRDPITYPVVIDDDYLQHHVSITNENKDCACHGSCDENGSCRCCPAGLEALYRRASETPSDINQHCEQLRKLASESGSVVEFGMRQKVSTVALLAGQPERFVTIAREHDAILSQLRRNAGKTHFEYKFGASLETDIPECDLLFLDTKHTGEHLAKELKRYAECVRQRIAIHDTDVFGECGEDGTAGLFAALRDFLKQEPSWRVIYHTPANYGLTVISRDPSDSALIPCPVNRFGGNGLSDLRRISKGAELKHLKGKHAGEDIYVIGSAASMDYVDPGFFAGRTVVGCNFVFRRFTVTYSVFQEGSEPQLREAASKSTVIMSRHPFGNTSFVPRQFGTDFPNYYWFPHRMNQCMTIDWDGLAEDEIVVSDSIITSAMHIAAYLGAKAIFLCGVDGGRLDGQLNYAGYQSDPQSPEQCEWYGKRVREIIPRTLETRDRLKSMYGCNVFMLSPFLNFAWEGHRFEQ